MRSCEWVDNKTFQLNGPINKIFQFIFAYFYLIINSIYDHSFKFIHLSHPTSDAQSIHNYTLTWMKQQFAFFLENNKMAYTMHVSLISINLFKAHLCKSSAEDSVKMTECFGDLGKICNTLTLDIEFPFRTPLDKGERHILV